MSHSFGIFVRRLAFRIDRFSGTFVSGDAGDETQGLMHTVVLILLTEAFSLKEYRQDNFILEIFFSSPLFWPSLNLLLIVYCTRLEN